MCFRDKAKKEDELSLSEIKKIVGNLPSSINEIHLIGGEVFLRNDIFEILDYLEDKGFNVRIQTNGTLIDDKKLKKLARYKNLMGVGFSIDGMRELHNKIRGSKNAFDKTIEAIKKTKTILPVSVNTVLLDENIDQIEEIFSFVKELGISEYRIEPEMFCTHEEIADSLIQPISANVRESGKYGFTPKDLMQIKKRLSKSTRNSWIKFVIAPRVAEIDADEFINGEIREKRRLFCKHLLVPRIDSEGNVIHCHIIKKKFGNLKEKALHEIWTGKEIKEFRRSLLTNNLLPVCKRCCRLRSI
jgi:radical SAM protein with 4Fe4S-binding SPASM domain